MSFDVFLQRFRAGDKAGADRAAVLAVLKQHQYYGPDEYGFYRVTMRNGVQVEFSARGLEAGGQFDSCAFHLRDMSPDICGFIFAVAQAGDMVILPAMEDFVPILVAPAQARELPTSLIEQFPAPPVCSGSKEVQIVLDGGYTGWLQYRNQVTSDK